MNILIGMNRYGGDDGKPDLGNLPPTIADSAIPVSKLRYSKQSKTLTKAAHFNAKPFIKGPIPLDWLNRAAKLNGKSLNVAMAIWWLAGMSEGKPFKLTAKALRSLHVSDDTACDCLNRIEEAGLIHVNRNPGQRPSIRIKEITQGDHHGQT